ncbi:hypothetical protein TraAM80_06810 [Trypanosoma rangeli]|uniref:Uncharacterized protein n=1 Tax=Trypanosoma rangeli TaxID=5698 RepID=A0A3S5IQQ3_TRYRA|nr:uncharacterized protein TraAM80_06810 [Trypanosoma rangeli]RNF01687.1 hypothetical protein TraAM80_06810 [Trypanosoma rangeli]|eukprot:RNF01687.1 hypothetical protein TraAM80_06810 [Trypanosoma rangeli]
MDQLRHLALSLSDPNLWEAREARLELARFMEPENLFNMWLQGEQETAETLLREAEAVGSPEVYAALGNAFKRLFDTSAGRAAAEEFLRLDTSHIVTRFLVNGVAHEDLYRAASVRPALISVMAILPSDLAPRVGELFSASLQNERVLRLFDENKPESPENEIVCQFLLHYTVLISFITSTTVDAFEHDPLLVANYLMISCIISRHVVIPPELLEKIDRALTEYKNTFVFCFVCRACATALQHHEVNATRYASSWGVKAALSLSQCDDNTRGAVYGILAATSTTAAGWSSVFPCVPINEEIIRALRVTALRPETLGLMDILAQSPHVPDSFFSSSLLQAAWQLHRDANDVTRENLWSFISDGLTRDNIVLSLATLCASFLCSLPHEVSVKVRELQLRVADFLVKRGGLSQEVVQGLKQFSSRGLYPPTSVGAEALAPR